MAAPLGNSNALGNPGGMGKSLNDRRLAAKVRTLTLKKIEKLFEIPDNERSAAEYQLYSAVLIKLSGTVLPRLTEMTGEDGEKLVISISSEIAKKNGINPTSPSTEDNS
jgi:hypothetical protein